MPFNVNSDLSCHSERERERDAFSLQINLTGNFHSRLQLRESRRALTATCGEILIVTRKWLSLSRDDHYDDGVSQGQECVYRWIASWGEWQINLIIINLLHVNWWSWRKVNKWPSLVSHSLLSSCWYLSCRSSAWLRSNYLTGREGRDGLFIEEERRQFVMF